SGKYNRHSLSPGAMCCTTVNSLHSCVDGRATPAYCHCPFRLIYRSIPSWAMAVRLFPGPCGLVHHFTAIWLLLVSKLMARPAECVSSRFTAGGIPGKAAVSIRWKNESVDKALPI